MSHPEYGNAVTNKSSTISERGKLTGNISEKQKVQDVHSSCFNYNYIAHAWKDWSLRASFHVLLVTSIFHDGISCTEKVHVGPIKCIFKVSAEAFFLHFLSVTKIKGEGDS